MNFFGGKKHKSPSELVKSMKEACQAISSNPKNVEKASEELSKGITSMKQILYGDNEHEPNPEASTQLATEVLTSDLIPLLVIHVNKMEFEAKKDLASVFNNLLRRQAASRSGGGGVSNPVCGVAVGIGAYPTVEYIYKNSEVLDNMVKGYEIADVAVTSGSMLRECIKHESLSKYLMYSNNFWDFFKYVEMANFDIASDAFATFKELLTKHKTLSAEFLEKNYDQVFDKYTLLLNSQNYVTRRQSLKLLGELLLDRANFNIMTRYISSSNNLKLMMNLLRDKSRSIQFEAFHVFKVFVANPNKTKPVLEILQKNKDRLIAFLTQFHNDKEEEQFNDEKAFLLKQIQAIQPE